ncbi:hypothetical protein ASG87_15790 [Frateuria sp. Soil773]|nr:hypothetical protein ASG87_15790 [Frateuria sp. Soil773]
MHAPTPLKAWGRALAVAAVLLALSVVAPGGAGAAAEAGDPALALVQRFGMGRGLETLANEAAAGTVTYGSLSRKHGVAAAKQLVATEIHRLLPDYQARWEQNLAAVYAKHFAPDELRSLAAQGKRSPYAAKFSATHAAVASDMRAASSGLLRQLVTEALLRAWNK